MQEQEKRSEVSSDKALQKVSNQTSGNFKSEVANKKKILNAPSKIAILITALSALVASFFLRSPTIGNKLEIPLSQIIEDVASGSVTSLSDSDSAIVSKDFTVEISGGANEVRLLIWDFAAEDGDEVEIYVNGKSITPAFMIRNDPQSFSIPVPSKVQVKGIKDGGGGITYAVSCPGNSTYFNLAPEGNFNTYTMIAKPKASFRIKLSL
ncbi:hypothetical protein [Leptospira sarikeiensis]|uniref:Uncharacterized protein n=1 Tax=Leptospira sarikeiensis TaxID=2484943 RepID=A0A4R9K7T6_9LEPT|nr:hypothetical protein [Leptospira sarikeiensis]TGL61702.1 hypothetical protein EHQ64_10070 [Leptospira sarikeiensis]